MSEDKDDKKSDRLTESAPLKKSYPVTPETKQELEKMVKRFVNYKPKPKSESA